MCASVYILIIQVIRKYEADLGNVEKHTEI